MIEKLCYLTIFVLTAINYFVALPVQVNVTAFSLAIIIAGSKRSAHEMIERFKAVHVDGKSAEEAGIETMSKDDAMKFPFFAGGMLCTLYALIKYFGKEIVNPLLLAYISLGGSTAISSCLVSFGIGLSLHEKKLIKCKIDKIGLDLEVSILDLICLIISLAGMGVYMYTKNWIYNNILATLFCLHGIQFLFLGNFQTGFILLIMLFFYDIFFVFGTDVMLTVAKSIDAPIKLLFPRNWSADPPEFSLLGLGDIVLPGVFIAMCLRFDIIKSLNGSKVDEWMKKGDGQRVVRSMLEANDSCPKTYFYGTLIGYLIAIITTVVVMIIFDHGQPALLYLVPGVLGSVLINAAIKGEIKQVFDFNEDKIVGDPEDDKQK